MKLQAMLIDDEIPILHNLKQVIPWEEMNVQVQLAKNGKEALNAIQAGMPDFILCDIRMPEMDGLTFVQEIRKRDIRCEILLITGYEQFEYAKIALQYGVRDYISKPINYEQLEKTVRELAERIRADKLEEHRKQREWSKVLDLANEKMMLDVLMGYSSIPAYYLRGVNDQEREMGYAIMLIAIDDYSQQSLAWNEKERKLWNFAVKNVLEETMREDGSSFAVIQTQEGEWCIVLPLDNETLPLPKNDMIRRAAQLQHSVQQNVKLTVSIGIHPGPIQQDQLAEAYKNIQWSLLVQPIKKPFIHYQAESLAEGRSSRSDKKPGELLMISAKDYIHRRLSSDFGIEEIAHHLGISTSYFSLLFKNYFGETFVEYVTKQRMELAKSYLLRSDKSVRQIGQQVGYLERRYFTKVFQKYTGITPSEYRERKTGRKARRG
ncbi:response regulator [Paenibacillus sp. J2TS4]|uniref:response regulator transcription factor n=1 Tax=Paenibacillus sp. J2TS4 TaxID=2807194 RepID=UPI001B0001B3|nr:response regulator [Paenibacillus sp. J2TS4]GIP32152.1 hypothetical protein J2TS4_13620 [Paenibacillus sp. J2TS4]